MRAHRFPAANKVFALQGGTEDNDLWVQMSTYTDGTPFIRSVWVLSDEDRRLIAAGQNITLTVLGTGTPPVSMSTTAEQAGKDPK